MLCLAMQGAPCTGKRPVLLAARNAHKALLYAAALLDFDIRWLCLRQRMPGRLCSLPHLPPQMLTQALQELTGQGSTPLWGLRHQPGLSGSVQDIAGLAAVCKARGVPLLVDNAHGRTCTFCPAAAATPLHWGRPCAAIPATRLCRS